MAERELRTVCYTKFMLRSISFRHHGRTIRGELAFPQRGRAPWPAILLVHGRGVDRTFPPILPSLNQACLRDGYATLAIDLSGHGRSSGKYEYHTYSRAKEDVIAAVKYLEHQPRINRFTIGAIGHSFGGTVVLLAKAAGANIKTLILLSPVGDTVSHTKRRYPSSVVREWRRTGAYSWPSARSDKIYTLRYQFYRDLQQIDSLKIAQNVHQPTLVISGDHDTNTPLLEARRLFKYLNEPKDLYVIPGATHNYRNPEHERLAIKKIRLWLKEYLGRRVVRSVILIVRNKNAILALKRSNQVQLYRGKWAIVGGHLPNGAVPLVHAYEELCEETGLRRSDVRLVRLHDIALDKTWVSTSFLFEAKTRKIRLDWEHTDFRWVRIKDFPFAQSYRGIKKQFKAVGVL